MPLLCTNKAVKEQRQKLEMIHLGLQAGSNTTRRVVTRRRMLKLTNDSQESLGTDKRRLGVGIRKSTPQGGTLKEANRCCSSEQHRQTKGRGFTAVPSRTTSSPPAKGNLGAGSPEGEIRSATAFMQFREVMLNNSNRLSDVRRREGW